MKTTIKVNNERELHVDYGTTSDLPFEQILITLEATNGENCNLDEMMRISGRQLAHIIERTVRYVQDIYDKSRLAIR